jgi:hypothetical protein
LFPLDKFIFNQYISDKLNLKKNKENPKYAQIRNKTRKLRKEILSLEPGMALKEKKNNFEN